MKKIYLVVLLSAIWLSASSQVYIGFSYVTPPIPVVNAGNDTIAALNSNIVLHGTITGGTQPYNYSWSPGSFLNDSTLMNPTATLSAAAYPHVIFMLKATDASGCIVSDQVKIDILVTDLQELQQHSLILYPNPNGGYFVIEGLAFETTELVITLRNIVGEMVFRGKFNAGMGKAQVNFADIKPGMYLAEITAGYQVFLKKVFIH